MKEFKFKGVKFFLIVVATYIIVAIFNFDTALNSLFKAFDIFKTILPILLIVVILTAIINFYLDPKTLAKHLGEDGGFKGFLIATVAGVLSHGPMYAWYPLLNELRKHGVKDGLIATFLYARAVKIPMLPLMAIYFGVKFTITFTILILIFAVLQGWLLDIILKRE